MVPERIFHPAWSLLMLDADCNQRHKDVI